MVKNIVGGKKGKMMANKNGVVRREQIRMVENDEFEMMVCVTKVFGGGLFLVVDNNGKEYRAFLRGKMKGHNMRHNLVSLFSVLLVAKRLDTDPTKCDILYVYDSHDIQFLALNPILNIANILSLHNNHFVCTNNNNNDDLLFSSSSSDNTHTITNTITHQNIDKENNKEENDNEDIDFDFI
jgi:translation initiation factor IF-1